MITVDEQTNFDLSEILVREYILQPGDRIWMPEIGLGIGRERGTYQGRTREWLFWYSEDGTRYLTQDEQMQNLLEKLRQQGIDPNTLEVNK